MALKDKFQILLLLTSISLLSNCTAQPTALIPASNTIDITEEPTAQPVSPSPTSTPTDSPDPTTAPKELVLSDLVEIKKSTVDELTLLGSFEAIDALRGSWSFSQDGTVLVATFTAPHGNRSIYTWNISTLRGPHRIEVIGSYGIEFFSQSRDQILIAKSFGSDVEISDLDTGELLYEIQGNVLDGGIPISSDGNIVAVKALYERNIILWDLSKQESIQVLSMDWLPDDPPYFYFATAFFSPDDTLLAAYVTDRTRSTVWDVETGERVHEFTNASVLAFSHNGKLLAARVNETQITLFNTSTWEQVAVIDNSNIQIESVVFSNDDELLITSAGDGSIAFWDWASGTKVHTITAYSAPPRESEDGVLYRSNGGFDLLLSPDGRLLVSHNLFNDTVHFWGVPR